MAQLQLPRGHRVYRVRRDRVSRAVAIHELLELDDEIREMLLAKKPGSEIRKKARDKGMAFLRDSALERVRDGITTLREINKVTFIEAGR